jgi:hypothetical protein
MVFIPSHDADPYFNLEKFSKEDIRRFLIKQYDLSFLEGILFLPADLTAVAVPPGTADRKAKKPRENFIFGIPKAYKEGEQWTVLPGAPLAYVKWNSISRYSASPELRGAVQGMDNIANFGKLVKEGIGTDAFLIHKEVVAAIDRYHKSERGKNVTSFQAFPLVHTDGTQTAFGVLNIHCDQPVFLGETPAGETSAVVTSRKRQQTFAAVITPIVFEDCERSEPMVGAC